jgi:leucyl aminopeptidase (aminopeptidase T)
MDYRELWREENEAVRERYDLTIERIGQIIKEETTQEPYREYFCRTAQFIILMDQARLLVEKGVWMNQTLAELKEWNRKFYGDILPQNYEKSYGNPAYAVEKLGLDIGRLLSFLYAEIRGEIVFVQESRLTEMTILNELFIEIYNLFEEEAPEAQKVKDILYWFTSDYTDLTVTYRVRETYDPTLNFAKDIVLFSDLSDLRYLYAYGEYISEEDIKLASFLNSLSQETVDQMADTYTEGYRKGFQVMGRDLSKKRTVAVLYQLGFERMVRKAIENFRAMGLEPILFRNAVWCVNRRPGRKRGFYGSSPNKQYEYDHRYDEGIYLKKAFTDRKLAVLKTAYETYKKEGADFGGPALIETFGEVGFQPVNKPECVALSEKQEKLTLAYANESAQIGNEYVPGHETSFTIIAFPRPEIGEDFSEIFQETIRINTLDYEIYKTIQQKLIDRLDRAEHVVITGKGDNHTNLKVMLHPLSNPDSQTNFENCVADVNIPLGEVFTSPVLKGTNGILQVSSVYIGDIQFQDLKLEFCDGMVKEYSCANFADPLQGKALIKQMILKNHDSLPMGEYAIGTNTTAYAMAQKFGIVDRLPILIVEKMGPHFAVGDTCYSWSEDSAVYNPDGKEVIARDNEVSALRKTDLVKAYFNCHTDITIPYRELSEIYGVTREGEKLPILADGRFVVPGTELLNEAFEHI